ncbi:putative bifunctional diguanylate cyclase/phosphodiesterase [Alkalimarinus sediminis]|uniref:cyclic-guanylate-specific phosphodiesterase n=1 Tax=Alkalimarinus sediminis TaxID=1632866 RepID=A0A9E8KPU8_9ALTE|nr:GGDEF domain-containing phosphodiesterase [Alkalimarinus sediminis]UZW75698.1 EAL domain-containing protein [Alkalimarinus sediminis]
MTVMHAKNQRLSIKLLRWVILTALFAGGLLSIGQISLDAFRAMDVLKNQAAQILDVVKDPATQAVYSIDPELAKQVVEGLFQQREIRYAGIGHPDETLLAEKSRPLQEAPFRWLTDPIFGKEQQFSVQLIKHEPEPVYYGDLVITIDTVYKSELFIERSVVVFISGILRASILAAILFLVYHYLLTRPLSNIIQSLLRVNPSEPGRQSIPAPRNHENDELGVWVNTANDLLGEISDNQQKRRAAEARVLKLSQYDPLTGLPNRLMFRNHLQNTLDDAKHAGHKVAVLCCGIDDFKSINSQFNYTVGDQLLQAFAERLSNNDGSLQTASRLGGDQFSLIQYNIHNAYNVAELAEKLLKRLNEPFEIEDYSINLYTTIGITIFPDDGSNADDLLQKSEQTMTLAKTVSRNQFQFYVASVDSEMRERKSMEKDLSNALNNNEFHIVFQPQIDYQSKAIIGAEVLLRWVHPTRGFVPPDIFIPIAENNGSIVDIGNWVLDEACRQAAIWQQQGHFIKLAINLSAVQLKDSAIEAYIKSTLEKHHIEPRYLEVEITETGVMENLSNAVETLNKIKQYGVSTAIDDFGTGYSSLSYLKKLPIDKVKIDKQFVHDLLIDEDDTSIVNAVIQLSKSLHLSVIAEGVETKEQEAYLVSRGCDMGQGYFYSRPVAAEEFLSYLLEYTRNPPQIG